MQNEKKFKKHEVGRYCVVECYVFGHFNLERFGILHKIMPGGALLVFVFQVDLDL